MNKADYLPIYSVAGFNRKKKKKKDRLPWKERGFCGQLWSLDSPATLPWVSSLWAYPLGLGLASLCHHINPFLNILCLRTSLAVQWLRVSNAGGAVSIPGERTEIPCAMWPKNK